MKSAFHFWSGVVLTLAAVAPASTVVTTNPPAAQFTSFTNATTAEVKSFMARWNVEIKEAGFLIGASRMVQAETNTTVLLTKLVGALEREPDGVWVSCLQIVAGPDQSSTLPPAELLAVWKQACGCLQKAVAAVPENRALEELLALARQSYVAACIQADTNLNDARVVAQRLLQSTPTNGWNYGNAVYDAHSALGRIALRQGDRATARRELHAAGQTPGSPQLNSFGPHFVLARELLRDGDSQDREAVAAFLDDVAKFWANPDNEPYEAYRQRRIENGKVIDMWKAEIRAGKIPSGGFHWR